MKTKPVSRVRCHEAAKYICENLDQPLNSRKCRAIKKHLQSCRGCSKDLADLKRVIALYRSESVARITPAVEKKLVAALQLKF